VIGIEGTALIDGLSAPAWALPAGSGFTLTAEGSAPVRVALLAGTPWREPLFMQGPFGMGSPEDLQRAMARFQAGEMGRLAPLPLRLTKNLGAFKTMGCAEREPPQSNVCCPHLCLKDRP
jgi:Pirin C-terminal cupin domain